MYIPALQRYLYLLNLHIFCVIRIHQPIFLQSGQPVPSRVSYGFEIIYTGVPAIEENNTGLKTPFFCFGKHISKMIIFCLAVDIYIVDSEINGNYSVSICPQQRTNIDSIHQSMLFSTPLMIDKAHIFSIWLVQRRIVNNQETILRLNNILYLIPQRIRIWRLSL